MHVTIRHASLQDLGLLNMTSVGGQPESILLKESVTRDHHVFKSIWSPWMGEVLLVSQETGNTHDRQAVALLKADRTVVGP